jgi:hypothetical protein
MNTIQLEVIDLHWKGAFRLKYDYSSNSYFPLENSIPSIFLKNVGLYQIYGNHPVYGSDVLLYIGKTDISFQDRFSGHFRSGIFYDYYTNLSVYLAPWKLPDEDPKIGLMELVESVLIFFHSPALNKEYFYLFKKGAEKYLIRNCGFFGSLNHTCTVAK